MFILGINAFHADSSACLLKDGELIAAAEEERFRRIKHWAGFPSEAISYCLGEANIRLEEVGHVAVNQDSKANLWKKIGYTLVKRPDLKMVLDRIKNKRERDSIDVHFSKEFPNDKLSAPIHSVEHHLAHLSSAFHVSPFNKAFVVSVDGFGDFASGAWGVAQGTDFVIDDRVYFPYSLGMFYQALTQFIGFPNYGDEYKVMGLAPYGEPVYMDEMRKIVLLKNNGSFELDMNYFRYHKEKIDYEWEDGAPVVGTIFSNKLADLLGPVRKKNDELAQRHKDIARSVQVMYEEAFFHILNHGYKRHGVDNLCLAGGCAMNSVANGKVTRNTKFKHVYIQSAAGDAGGAIGAAYVTWYKLTGRSKHENSCMSNASLGPSFSNQQIKEFLAEQESLLAETSCNVACFDDENELCHNVAEAISEGKVVGWFQGHMEWGPRALGNRSILGDPRRSDMKEILNLKIKRRESFRPFAPSILRERVADWFEQDDDVPFMMKVFQIHQEKRAQIPAVTHVDGSGRLQTVYKRSNPRYYQLIESFEKKTGVPMVLNTSFNENEPVVCLPSEAFDCFMRTKMDMLVLENYIIQRQNGQ